MGDDIVTRLTDHPHTLVDRCECVRCEAAAEIELLTEWRKNALLALDKREDEIARLREALTEARSELARLESDEARRG